MELTSHIPMECPLNFGNSYRSQVYSLASLLHLAYIVKIWFTFLAESKVKSCEFVYEVKNFKKIALPSSSS
jgi:hypothetical protein